MTLKLADLYRSPDHYLHSFDGNMALFRPMDRAAYHRSIFLDGRISPAGDGTMQVSVAALSGEIPTPQPTGWIMHVAHCGSTLLARALDQVGTNLMLREPQALRQLAFVPTDERLTLTAAMLSKRYDTTLPTIVKGNVPINFLLLGLVAVDAAARMIFLHLPLRDYLLAILRSENHREWLRRVTTQLAHHLGSVEQMSDVDRACTLWLAQMRIYAAAAGRMPNARSLNGETFFAMPALVLRAAALHLEVPLSDRDAERTIAGPLFATYSKNPDLSFDNTERVARRSVVEAALVAELDQAEIWIEQRQDQAAAAAATLAAIELVG